MKNIVTILQFIGKVFTILSLLVVFCCPLLAAYIDIYTPGMLAGFTPIDIINMMVLVLMFVTTPSVFLATCLD